MTRFTIIIVAILLSNCTTQLKVIEEKKITAGEQYKTNGHKSPYVYINGFDSYQIIKKKQPNDTIIFNQLRFNNVYSSFYSKKIMFDKFGKWDKAFFEKGKKHPTLVWFKKKLFEDKNELFTIFTYGNESDSEIYASFSVSDKNHDDVFKRNHENKSLLIAYFINCFKDMSNNEEFYNDYWDTVKHKKGVIKK